MKALFYILTVAAISSQLPHAYYTFNSFSRLTGWMKEVQSATFCGIISVAIFAFVLIGNSKMAFYGMLVEVVINLYYYSMDFWKYGYGQKTKKQKSTLKWWRQNWIAVFFSPLLPGMIYLLAEQLKGM